MQTFKQAIRISDSYSRRHAILGNGFSISCRPNIFVYEKLFERADFSNLSSAAKQAFKELKTEDFEKVINALKDTGKVLRAYHDDKKLIKKLEKDANGLREVLVNAIASSHPEWPGEITDSEYKACRKFIKNFNNVYTLNYDLLLYWALMHEEEEEEKLESDDGFRKPDQEEESEYVVWEASTSRKQNIWYLHGALHIFDAGTEIQKYTWVNTGERLIEQIREALENNYFPLFVAEGTSNEKLDKIMHSEFLAKGRRSLSNIGGALFLHGHSLDTNDTHILKCIEKGKIEHLFVGLYGDESSESNKAIKKRAKKIVNHRSSRKPLELSFYDSESAKVWG